MSGRAVTVTVTQIFDSRLRRPSYLLAIITVLLCACGRVGSSSEKISVAVRQSDAAVREQLLQLTPIGTSAQQVFEFLSLRLRADSKVFGAPGQPYRSSMTVDLGHYFTAGSFLLFPTVVQASWNFDEDDRLRNVQVRRFVRGM